MTDSSLKPFFADAEEALKAGDAVAAFASIRLIASRMGDTAEKARIDAVEQRYFYMLRFLLQGGEVPEAGNERADVLAAASDSLRRLNYRWLRASDDSLFFSQARYCEMRPEENLESLISDYLAEHDRLRTDAAALTDSGQRARLEQISTDIFNRLWVELPMENSTADLVESIVADESLPLHDRILWIHAIGLGALRIDEPTRMDTLARIARKELPAISAPAAVWLVLSGRPAPHRAEVYREIARAAGTESLETDLKSKIDGLMEKGRDIFNGGDPAANLGPEGFEAMKAFAEEQSKGADVFMSTLGKMRHFDFFRPVANWFLPFHTSHSALAEIVDGEGAGMAAAIEKIPALCDSDKYALILSMVQTPPAMRKAAFDMMATQYNEILASDQFDELIKASKAGTAEYQINNTVKNLYRFFRLFRRKGEFGDPFKDLLDNRKVFRDIAREASDEYLSELTEMFVKAGRHDLASVSLPILASRQPDVARWPLLQGRNALASGKKVIALAFYTKSLALSPKDFNVTLEAVDVALELNMYEDAMRYLLAVEDVASEDTRYLKTLARVAYATGDYSRMLQALYNLEYILPDGDNEVKTMLARALTLTGDTDTAEAYFSSVDSMEPEAKVYHGVMLWMTGRRAPAVDRLMEAARDLGSDENDVFGILADVVRRIRTMDNPPCNPALFDTLPDIIRYRLRGTDFI